MSEKAYETLASKISPELQYTAENLERLYGDEEVIKSYFFAALVINYFKDPQIGIPTAIKTRELQTIPETLSFRAMRYMPFVS